ncbi:MAG TPA: hypothetical protein VGQ49_11185 [Bryobacteraceae bacterium]|nr:hypothetical protein [Bryobacteraceae bacterium]
MEMFTHDMLRALSAWQNGWGEDQGRKATLATALQDHTANLETQFRIATVPCFRKRFIHQGELVDLLIKDSLAEGMTSWTTDQRFAERFKGLARKGAVAAAVYSHTPSAEEVIINIGELWRTSEFTTAAEAFRERYADDAKALFHFRDRQSEVVLVTALKGSEIVALSGASSPFDELCDADGIPEENRDALYRKLVEAGVYPGELMYTYAAPDVIARTILSFREKLEQLKNM